MAFTGRSLKFDFDPFELVGLDRPSRVPESLKNDLCDYIREEVLSRVGDGQSPIASGAWKRSLSKDYKKQKAKYSSVDYANMELHGDMLDALECVPSSSGLTLRVMGSSEAAKADGHNNHSGRSKLPLREFIPKDDQTFKRDILQGMKRMIKDAINDGS